MFPPMGEDGLVSFTRILKLRYVWLSRRVAPAIEDANLQNIYGCEPLWQYTTCCNSYVIICPCPHNGWLCNSTPEDHGFESQPAPHIGGGEGDRGALL